MEETIFKFYNKLKTGDNRLSLLDQRYLPRWAVVLLDVFFCSVSWALVYTILNGTPLFFHAQLSILEQGAFIIGINLFFFFIFTLLFLSIQDNPHHTYHLQSSDSKHT